MIDKIKMKTFNKDLTSFAKNLRKNMTPEEKHLWYDFFKKLPVSVYRQHIIGNYIVDFYIPTKNIIIEIDGRQHLENEHKENDRVRDEFLAKQGLKVLRFPNESIHKNFSDICEIILNNIGFTFEDLKRN